ncbi:hypothetical protein GCM10007868_15930 [Gluconobacter frateurii]|nr:hypothetical protein GCM10007868_15930 [Gluconobacter frateurii]
MGVTIGKAGPDHLALQVDVAEGMGELTCRDDLRDVSVFERDIAELAACEC